MWCGREKGETNLGVKMRRRLASGHHGGVWGKCVKGCERQRRPRRQEGGREEGAYLVDTIAG